MRKNIFFLVYLLIIILPYVSAGILETCKQNNLSCLNIFVDIEPYNYKEFFVASDSIYFNITFKNEYEDKDINDILLIKLLSPSGNIIYLDNYAIELKPNETKNMISKGGFEGEQSAIFLNTIGTYTLIVESKNYYFYENLQGGRWIRHTNEFSYAFDTMPKWQYDLWKSQQESNRELIDLTQDLKENLEDSSNSSDKMYRATIFLLIIGLIQLLFIASQIASSKDARRAFAKIIAGLILFIGMLILLIILFISLFSKEINLTIKIINSVVVILAILVSLKDMINLVRSWRKQNEPSQIP